MMYVMHRTQVNLEEWQIEALRARASAEGCSLGALIRDIVTAFLAPDPERRKRVLDSIEIVDDGGAHDVARDHDHHLYGWPRDSDADPSGS